jgi:hypothetical protein
MPRPGLTPAASTHERHDPLLVAQVVAGDDLDPVREHEARGWLSTCAECARMAADLRAVSAVVAAEPVSPRRRDFRLDPEQAERVRGNAFSRFLRGFSLPRAGALRPAAAGIMSVGLAFVVAGYVWPEDGSVTVAPETNQAPVTIEERAAAPVAEVGVESPRPASDVADRVEAPPSTELGLAADEQAAAPQTVTDQTADGQAAAERAADARAGDAQVRDTGAADAQAPAAEPEFLEGLAQHQAGDSAESAAVAEALESLLADDTDAAYFARSVDESAAGDAGARGNDDATAQAVENERVGEKASAAGVAPRETPAAADGGTDAEQPAVGTDDGFRLTGATVAEDGDAGLGPWLILVGAALAVGGGSLLLLAWLGRRAADPLLR